MTKDTARDLKPVPNSVWSARNIGQPRAALMEVSNVHENMALAQSDTTDMAAAIGQPTTIDLADFGLNVPEGTTADLTIHGDRSGFVMEVTRRADTWTIEGARNTAELTAVRGEHTLADVERVPPWLERVLSVVGVEEVELGR